MEDLYSNTQTTEATATEQVGGDASAQAEGEATVAVKKPKKPINQQKLQDNIWGWAFCSPLIIGTTFFVFVAFVLAIIISFTNYNSYAGKLFDYFGSSKFQWAQSLDGSKTTNIFSWYIRIFSPEYQLEETWKTLFNTVFYMIGIPIGMILSMVFAVLMSRDIKGGNLFRVIYYLPVVSSTVAVTFTFQNLFKNGGVMDQIFKPFFPNGVGWMTSPGYWQGSILAKWVVIIMSVWKGLGGTIILFCAGLSGVNAATKEAAEIDGANGWQIFWKVTIPDLMPTIFYTTVTSVIGGMQIYAEPQLLFNVSGGVAKGTDGYVAMIWYYGMGGTTVNYYSYGCALGMVLFVIILLLTLLQFKLQKQD